MIPNADRSLLLYNTQIVLWRVMVLPLTDQGPLIGATMYTQ